MSSITNVNNNSSVVNVGRTTPVSPGAQTSDKSIPVVVATDQTAIPVVEQNKVQSEVALSLLGIPRAEVALGIFADVNTYDVNPSEWSSSPAYHIGSSTASEQGHGIKHLPTEAGALVEAPRNKVAVLTSKRFFRYQPGRVSAATFGIKSTVGTQGGTSPTEYSPNPSIRKFGIYDNFDGYFWETRNNSLGDNFSVVRRSQALLKCPNTTFGIGGITTYRGDSTDGDGPTPTIPTTQIDDYRIIGKGKPESGAYTDVVPQLSSDRKILEDNRFTIIATANTALKNADSDFYEQLDDALNNTETEATLEAKCLRDADYWIDFFLLDMEWGSLAHTKINGTNYKTAFLPAPHTYEKVFYLHLKNALLASSNGFSSAGITKLTTLIDLLVGAGNLTTALTTTAVVTDNAADAGASGIFNTSVAGNGSTVGANVHTALITDYGNKNKIDTIFDAKKHYWAYLVTTKDIDGDAIVYTVPAGGLSSGLTAEDLKYKCQRDVGYLIDGYKNDIVGGGDAETVYNMSMFFKASGMSIYSQSIAGPSGGYVASGTAGAILSERERYTHLRAKILASLDDTIFGYVDGAADGVYDKVESLLDMTVANFISEHSTTMSYGSRGYAGNLVAMRDGLIVTHAAVYDPSLLKDENPIETVIESASDNKLKLTKGHVTFGQTIKYVSGDIGGLTAGTLYKVARVYGPKGNIFKLIKADPALASTAVAISGSNTGVFELVVPFIFPKDYDNQVYNATTFDSSVLGVSVASAEPVDIPAGPVFPYAYSSTDDLTSDDSTNKTIGFINTARDLSVPAQFEFFRTEMDSINFYPEYINWIKNNVKPEYWGVYDYRVPRSRFSHDVLNGIAATSALAKNRVYSDLATAPDGTVARPGKGYAATVGGVVEKQSSEYNFDFTKVTMLKIEFSWYGAVGALFLAYVPVANGEARWVRVHHLRASNQLKIASLGNATLPITYTTYGGGESAATTAGRTSSTRTLTLGDGETNVDKGYGSSSNHIVKYGASYYIDGGDRGTVRLYSHNNDSSVSAYGRKFTGDGDWSNESEYTAADTLTTISSANNETLASIDCVAADTDTLVASSATPINPRFFMGAKLLTNNPVDQNVKVIWADETKVYLSSVPLGAPSALIADRAANVFGIQTKKTILSTQEGNAVRNRVQVYPTKLSASNTATDATPVRLRFRKTPKFQYSCETTGKVSIDTADYTVTTANIAIPLVKNVSVTNLNHTAFNVNDTVTVTGHPFETGQPVKYSKGSAGNTEVGGLDDNVVYYVNKTGANSLKLYTTEALALLGGTAIDLTSGGSGTDHALLAPTGDYIADGKSVYGWFRGKVGNDKVTVFGRLYRVATNYFFEVLESYNGTITLFKGQRFLPDLNFRATGEQQPLTIDEAVNYTEKEGLSSVNIAPRTIVPIPGTGVNVATIYLQPGTEQIDLATYFDYNKEYLSFPLTNEADTLYFSVDSDQPATFAGRDEISLGVTWEEQ